MRSNLNTFARIKIHLYPMISNSKVLKLHTGLTSACIYCDQPRILLLVIDPSFSSRIFAFLNFDQQMILTTTSTLEL